MNSRRICRARLETTRLAATTRTEGALREVSVGCKSCWMESNAHVRIVLNRKVGFRRRCRGSSYVAGCELAQTTTAGLRQGGAATAWTAMENRDHPTRLTQWVSRGHPERNPGGGWI